MSSSAFASFQPNLWTINTKIEAIIITFTIKKLPLVYAFDWWPFASLV
jgi:hypothetical protein